MNKIIIFILVLILPAGCIGKKTLEFCEGVSPEGEGVNCGEKFSTGEITVLIKPKSDFGVSKIAVDIYRKGKYKMEKTESLSLDVVPEESAAKTNLYFYDEGKFIVEVTGGDTKIAEGSISIIDVY